MTKPQETANRISSGATFGPRRRYRYRLWRTWNSDEARVLFVLLNPSTADERVNDPTIRRCIGFAQTWGYGGVEIVNIFAYRSTDPAALREISDPIGPRNDYHIKAARRRSARCIAAWGNHGAHLERGARVLRALGRLGEVECLCETKTGQPGHPLYISARTLPRPISH